MELVYPNSASIKIPLKKFTKLADAYQILSNPKRKENYDLSLRIQDKDISILLRGKNGAFFHRGKKGSGILTMKAKSSLELELTEKGIELMRYSPSQKEILENRSI
jgi:curved DNA-binding protein CbpA